MLIVQAIDEKQTDKYSLHPSQRSIKLAEELNCSYDKNAVEDTLECLRDKDFDAITSKEYFVGDYILNYFPFVPTVDDTFMPRSPKTMLEMNYFKDISILIGSNANEGYWSLMYLLPDMFPNNELKVSDRTLTEEKYMEAVSKIFSFYPESVSFICNFFQCPIQQSDFNFSRCKNSLLMNIWTNSVDLNHSTNPLT